LSVPDEGYSRNVSRALNFISFFILLLLGGILLQVSVVPGGIVKENSRMDNPEINNVMHRTQNEDKQNKKTQHRKLNG
jgi:hypothetical protein